MEYETELGDKGGFGTKKIETDMKLAKREAVKRIDGVSYSNDRITSYSAPDE